MYRKTNLGWRLRRIIGGQSVEKVDRFIAEGVALDKAAKTQATSTQPPLEGKSAGSSRNNDRST